MARGKNPSFFNRAEEVADQAIAWVDKAKEMAKRKEDDRAILSPGFTRPVAVSHQETSTFPDFPAVEPNPAGGRRFYVPPHRNPVTGGCDRKNGGAKESLTKHYA